ncbi:MAG: LysR family transcriptional regulator [Gammaproteobacteria bacterium]|nr:LysR family transcriptional regulator [Gammaproteobacteria bacterium]
MVPYKGLEVLLAVADYGSFAAAGDSIGLTQSAVSLQIKSLEESFDTVLFDRSKRPPVLNADGALLVQKSRPLIQQLNKLKLTFTERHYSGTLHIGAIPSVLTGVLPRALSQMQQQHPRLLVNLVTGLSREITAMVQKGKLDGAIVSEPLRSYPGLTWHPFAAEPLMVISPPGTEGLSDIELLSRFPFLQFYKQSWIGQMIDSLLAERNIKVHANMEVDSMESIKLMVAEGLGVSIVPLRSHRGDFDQKLVFSPFGSKPVKRVVGIIESESNQNSELIQVLHKILLAQTSMAL